MAKDSKFNVTVGEGEDSDNFSENVRVSETLNVVPTPDGKSMFNRNGTAVYGRVNPGLTGDQAGRIAYQRITTPPNLTDGHILLLAANTSNNNAIQKGILARPRGNVEGDSAQSTVYFSQETYVVDLGETVTITVYRKSAIDRLVSVTLTSSNGTGTAGVDYTAISTTLTFQPGDTSKTVTFTSIAASQTANKTAILTLSNPTGGCVIGSPNPATVLMLATYVPVGYSSNSSPKLCRVMMHRKMQNDVTCHYLNTYTGNFQDIGRCGADQLFVLSWDGSNVYVALYSITTMRSDGGAYSAGAGTINAAIKTAPYAEFILFNTDSVTDVDQIHYTCYTERYFYMYNGQNVWQIDMVAGNVSNHFSMPQVGSDTSYLPYATPPNYFRMGYADYQGRLLIYFENQAGTACALAALNPVTMAFEATTGWKPGLILNQNVPLYGGGYFAVDEGPNPDRMYRIPSDMSSLTSIGTFDSYNEGAVPVNKSNVVFMSESPSFSFVRQVLIGTTSTTTQQSYAAGGWTPGICWFNESRALMQFVSGGTRTVLLLNTGSGATAATCNNVDRYNGQTVDADITTTPDDGMDPDMCWYHCRNIANRVRA